MEPTPEGAPRSAALVSRLGGAPAALAVSVVLIAAMTGCRSQAPVDLVGTASAPDDDWFCDPSTVGEWNCVQDAALVANPPQRIPVPPAAQPPPRARAATAAAYPRPARPAPPPRAAQAADRAPATASPAPAATRPVPTPAADAHAPLYQRLAYRPTSPVSLEDLPGSFYALQLLALRSQASLDEAARELGIPGMARIPIESNGELWHVLLLRIYSDRATAERAAASLPERIREMNPWPRPLRSLQAAMASGDQLREGASEVR